MCSVRGIGVAESASTSTSSRSERRSSFWATPKRCSSSRITSPSSLGITSRERTRWVPTRTSTLPAAKSASTCFVSAGFRKRDTISTLSGKSRKRSRNVFQCCSARIVVGQSTSTCRSLTATANAARTATSVLPKPTSPQTSRSIGRVDSRSSLTASIARAWSSVSRVRERCLEPLEPLVREVEARALGTLALGIEREELTGELADRLARAGS